MADLSPSSEVLTQLNVCRSPGQGIGRPGLMVTSHCADRISGRWVTFPTLHNRSRSHFRFQKRMWRHPRWRTEAEMAPAPVMERWESYLHYFCYLLDLIINLVHLFLDENGKRYFDMDFYGGQGDPYSSVRTMKLHHFHSNLSARAKILHNYWSFAQLPFCQKW